MDVYKHNYTIVELELFSYLCFKAGEQMSQREIALALNVSPTAIGYAVKSLIEKNLILMKKMKTINLISFNRENHQAIQLKRAENLRQLYLSELPDVLEERLAGASIILFGSYARGEDTTESDIDIAVVGRNKKTIDLETFEQKLGRKIYVNFYESFKNINKNLKNNLVSGIVLSGILEL